MKPALPLMMSSRSPRAEAAPRGPCGVPTVDELVGVERRPGLDAAPGDARKSRVEAILARAGQLIDRVSAWARRPWRSSG